MPPSDNEVFLVTGALGCIGAWTVRQLLEDGRRVVGLDLGADEARLDLVLGDRDRGGLSLIAGDITDLPSLLSTIERQGVTNVIHLAALQVPFCRADPPLGARVNVVGTVNVFEAARLIDHVRGIVFASSLAVYDAADADPETGSVGGDATAHPKTHYGVYKQANEATASVYWDESGVPSLGVRPYVVYGPGRDQGMTSAPTMAMFAATIGRPHHIPYGGRCQLQFAGDVASTLIHAARNLPDGASVFNLDGPVVAMSEVVAAIAAAVPGAKVTFDDVPLPFPDSGDCSPLHEAIGPLPIRSLEEGVAETVACFARLSEDDPISAGLVRRLDG